MINAANNVGIGKTPLHKALIRLLAQEPSPWCWRHTDGHQRREIVLEDVDLGGTIINNAGGADGNVIIQAGATVSPWPLVNPSP